MIRDNPSSHLNIFYGWFWIDKRWLLPDHNNAVVKRELMRLIESTARVAKTLNQIWEPAQSWWEMGAKPISSETRARVAVLSRELSSINRVVWVPDLFLQVKPVLGVNEMPVTREWFVNITLSVWVSPPSFQITQYWSEVFPVVSFWCILVSPSFEPFSHFHHLRFRGFQWRHFRWDRWEWNRFPFSITGICPMWHI